MRFDEPRRGYAYYHERRAPRDQQPLATYGLLGLMLATYIAQLSVQASRGSLAMLEVFAIHIDWMYRPWSLVTSVFAHGSVNHLLFNGLFLYFFGPTLERIIGVKRYVALFLLTGALAGVAQVEIEKLLEPYNAPLFEPRYSLGASGALMAFFGVTLVLLPRSKAMIFPFPVPVPLYVLGFGYLGINLLYALTPGSGIGAFAHLSGLALGALYGIRVKKALARAGLRLIVN